MQKQNKQIQSPMQTLAKRFYQQQMARAVAQERMKRMIMKRSLTNMVRRRYFNPSDDSVYY